MAPRRKFSGNQVGSAKFLWIRGEYGLGGVWIRRESTVGTGGEYRGTASYTGGAVIAKVTSRQMRVRTAC